MVGLHLNRWWSGQERWCLSLLIHEEEKTAKQTEGREVEHSKLQISCCMKDFDMFEKVNLKVKYQLEMRVRKVRNRGNEMNSKLWQS